MPAAWQSQFRGILAQVTSVASFQWLNKASITAPL